MARKNARIHQKNAERKARKVNRLAANGRMARKAKAKLYEKTAEVNFRTQDVGFDKKTEQVFTVAVKVGEDIRTHIGICLQTETMDKLAETALGMNMALAGEGAVLLRFPVSWSVERVVRSISSDAWGLQVFMDVMRNPGQVLCSDGEKYGNYINELVNDFTGWIADCGSAPNRDGIVEVDVESSAISHVAYDANEKTMTITFKNDRRYVYSDVPRKRFASLVSADSVGRYFLDNIRGFYDYERVA